MKKNPTNQLSNNGKYDIIKKMTNPRIRALGIAFYFDEEARVFDLSDLAGEQRLTDQDVQDIIFILHGNKQIEELNLSGLLNGDDHMELIANALEDNSSLRVINLSNCNLSNRGMGYLAQMLLNNNNIRTLDLHGNPLRYDIMHPSLLPILQQHSDEIESLNLSNTGFYDGGQYEMKASLFDAIKDCKNLKELDLSSNCFKKKNLDTEWDKEYNDDLSSFLEMLHFLKNLETLNLANIHNINAEKHLPYIFSDIKHDKRIKNLNMENCGEDPIHIAVFGKTLNKLKLTKLENHASMRLQNQISDNECAIEELSLSDMSVREISIVLKKLSKNTSIKKLSLGINLDLSISIDEESENLREIISQINKNTSIEELELAPKAPRDVDSNLGSDVFKAKRHILKNLTEELKNNKRIKKFSLRLSENEIRDISYTDIAHLINNNPNLESLALPLSLFDYYDDEGVKNIFDAVEKNSTINVLDDNTSTPDQEAMKLEVVTRFINLLNNRKTPLNLVLSGPTAIVYLTDLYDAMEQNHNITCSFHEKDIYKAIIHDIERRIKAIVVAADEARKATSGLSRKSMDDFYAEQKQDLEQILRDIPATMDLMIRRSRKNVLKNYEEGIIMAKEAWDNMYPVGIARNARGQYVHPSDVAEIRNPIKRKIVKIPQNYSNDYISTNDINTTYWYSENDIGMIIGRSLQGLDSNVVFSVPGEGSSVTSITHGNNGTQYDNVHVMRNDGTLFTNGRGESFSIFRGALIRGQGVDAVNAREELIRNIQQSANFASEHGALDNHIMLFPYNTNGHWGLGRISVQNNAENGLTARIEIYDPLGKNAGQTVADELNTTLNDALSNNNPVRSITSIVVENAGKVKQQMDSASCGVITTENAIAMLTGDYEILSRQYLAGARDARAAHIGIADDVYFSLNQAANIDYRAQLEANDVIDNVRVESLVTIIEDQFLPHYTSNQGSIENFEQYIRDQVRSFVVNNRNNINDETTQIISRLFIDSNANELAFNDDGINHLSRAVKVVFEKQQELNKQKDLQNKLPIKTERLDSSSGHKEESKGPSQLKKHQKKFVDVVNSSREAEKDRGKRYDM